MYLGYSVPVYLYTSIPMYLVIGEASKPWKPHLAIVRAPQSDR